MKFIFKIYIFSLVVFLILSLSSKELLAISSSNYQIEPEQPGGIHQESTSSNYQMESFIGDPARGDSASATFETEHGFFYPEEEDVLINLKALPELRVPATGNFDTHLTVEVRNPGSTTPLFSQTVDTDTDGLYSGLFLTGISPGTYDLTGKGYSHLRDKEINVILISGSNFVDFSNGETDYLLAGDVNGTNGDNVVNSIDIAIEVIKLDQGAGIEREDLNQDSIVNSVDLAMTIKNLDLWGDL